LSAQAARVVDAAVPVARARPAPARVDTLDLFDT